MKKTWSRMLAVYLVLVLMLALGGCGSSAAEPAGEAPAVELTVSAAASLTDALTEIQGLYADAAPEVTLTINFGSSGALQQQISEGAEVDVYFAAAAKQINTLESEGLLGEDGYLNLLGNRLVLVVPADSAADIYSFEDLAGDSVESFAMGEPASVPAGKYAEEVLAALGIADAVQGKIVYAKDVREVLTWVESGNADAGAVYMTDALTSDAVRVVAEAPEGSHQQIVYPAAVIGSSDTPEASQAFIEFLQTEAAAAVFEKYGFTVL